jgi:hypothetical protein
VDRPGYSTVLSVADPVKKPGYELGVFPAVCPVVKPGYGLAVFTFSVVNPVAKP